MRLRHTWKYSLVPRIIWLIKISFKFIPLILLVYLAFHLVPNLFLEQDFPPTWPQNQTRDVRKLIKPNEKTSKLLPKNVCDGENEQIILLIMVTSAVSNSERRRAIRDTWGKDRFEFSEQIKLLFLIGESPSDTLQTEVNEEYKEFGDVLQESFVDSYANLTIKSLFMLKWFSQYCTEHVQYLMKVDDDMYINVPEVYNLVKENKNMNMLTGFMHCGAAPMTHGKQYAPSYMLNDIKESTYPNFLSGTAYVMSNTTAEILYRTSMIIPAFHLEDVYLTGILPTYYNQLLYEVNEQSLIPSSVFQNKELSIKEKEIHPHNDGRFSIYNIEKDPCLYAKLISSHELDIHEIRAIHEKVTKLRKTSDDNTKICANHKQSNKRLKTCNSKNTMFGGKGECCGYIEYIMTYLFNT